MAIFIIFFGILNQIWVILAIHAFSSYICESSISFLSIIILHEVSFIGHKANDHVKIREFSNLVQPVPQVYKWLNISNIVHQESTDGKPVMSGRYAQELAGSRGIPDLRFYSLIAIWKRNIFEFKLNAVSGFGFWVVIAFGDSK